MSWVTFINYITSILYYLILKNLVKHIYRLKLMKALSGEKCKVMEGSCSPSAFLEERERRAVKNTDRKTRFSETGGKAIRDGGELGELTVECWPWAELRSCLRDASHLLVKCRRSSSLKERRVGLGMLQDENGEGLEGPESGMGKRHVCASLLGG